MDVLAYDLFKQIGSQLSNFDAHTYDTYVTPVVTNVTMKIGLYLMIFFFIMEVAKIFQQANQNNDGNVAPVTILQCGVYFLLAGAMVAGSLVILNFLNMIIVGGINLLHGTGSYNVFSFTAPKLTMPGFSFTDIGGFVGNVITAAISWIVSFLVGIVASVIMMVLITVRVIQLYVYTILSPIAFSSFASSEYRSIGVGFIKSYFALLIQGMVMLVILGVYNAFNGSWDTSGVTDTTLASLVFPVAMCYLLFKSNSIAKAIVGLAG
ncbi:MAG: hypothetical protein LBI43_06800 [Streptococcaceae bacterium]|jgi:hypothetical protein|nr:hypothetical protein [Streptococcaceae bacterium]